jgi:hypothetical protein
MRFISNSAFLLTTACLLLQCTKPEKKADTLFEKLEADQTGIQFFNKVENTEDFNIFSYRNFYNGGGVSIGDLNNDGLPEVFMTSNMGENQLFLNKGNFKFENITAKSGVAGKKFWSTGAVMVDINADGLLDIFVCNAGYKPDELPEKELFINKGAGPDGIPVFEEKAAEYGLNETGYTTHAAFFDYDGDGDLDCYILNNSFMPVNTLNYSNNREMYAEDWPVADFLKGGGDKLFRNDGPPQGNGKGGFVDVTRQSGIYGSLIGFGLGVTVGDVNGDFWPDLYISNDFFERDYLYINQKNGTFKESIENRMEHISHASMGSDMADINNDGFPEIFTTEMLPSDETRLKTTTVFENYNIYSLKQERGFYHQYMQNCLQLNNKDQTFSEIAHYSGVAASDWSWGALMFDADNDGLRDIYVCNGIYKDVINQDFIDFFADEVVRKMALNGKKEQINEILNKMPSTPILNKAYHNLGNLRFDDLGEKWGFTTPSFSNGAAYGDLDNDGDLDLVINNVNQDAFVYRNKAENGTNKPHYISITLQGKDQNTFAVGSMTSVYRGKEQLNFQLNPSRGFQSSVDYKMVFGLGATAKVDSVVVIWPDRQKSVVFNPTLDTLLKLSWKDAKPTQLKNPYDYNNIATAVMKAAPCTFEAHHEDAFVDFYQEGLSFRMLSREGPCAAVADVNNDGREDVYIGGAAGQAGQLYVQTASGAFTRTDRPAFDRDSLFEDTYVCFFDADGDHDADLFVGTGGNEQPLNARLMQNRVYFNDGKGHFTLNERALPLNGYNTAVAVPFDYDNDGDLDLFVWSRSVPAKYGVPPRHFLYQNDGKGNFTDISKTAAPGFDQLGMVTAACLSNVTGDAANELIVVGEWSAPTIFEVKSGKLIKVNSNLDKFPGWYYAVQTDDVDGDGDQDLILGNRGENFYFDADAEHPAKLWINDFDKNGDIEKIMTRSIGGKDMPIPLKKELTTQLPLLKKKNLKHVDYAQKSIQDLLPKEGIESALVREATYFKSAIAINQGNGNFTLQALPMEVQFSCVKAILVQDLNGDGKKDLVLAGNDAGFMPQYSKLDASFGHVLINQGNGQYLRMENRDSGFFVRGDVKSLITLPVNGKKSLLVTINNQKPLLFNLK